jgi:hypothetical protein
MAAQVKIEKEHHKMLHELYLFLIVLLFSGPVAAQETYHIAYGGFAGFQAPIWATKDLGLLDKYGLNGEVVMVPGSTREIQALL